jgi:hypothetical protein
MTALAATAMMSAMPAFAAVTVATTNGTPLSYQIFGIKDTGNPVYGSSPNNTNDPNVTYTGNATTTMGITNGFAQVNDADPKHPSFNALIINPTDFNFGQMKFSLQLTADASFSVYYLLSGSGLNPDDFASYTLLGNTFSQAASANNNYLISGATFDSIMIKVTTANAFLFEVKQNSYEPTGDALPEPATWGMMLLGFAGMGLAIRRSRRRSGALMQIA